MLLIRNIFIVLTVLLSVSCVYGQSYSKPHNNGIMFKIYSTTFLDLDSYKSHENFIKSLRTFSPSISWKSNFDNFQEVELKDFKLSFSEKPFVKSGGIEYSYNWKMGSSFSESKVRFYLGAGAGSYYTNQKTFLNTNFTYYLVAIPRVQVKLNKNTYIDLSMPYNVYLKGYEYTVNPEATSQPIVSPTAFPNKLTVKVGVAIKF